MRIRFIRVFVIFLSLLSLTACGKKDKIILTCKQEDNESYQYEGMLGTTYIIKGEFTDSQTVVSYSMEMIMRFKSDIDDETFNEYVLENEENVSMFDKSNERIKYQTDKDTKNKTISYSLVAESVDEELGKSGEVFSPIMYTLKGFKESLEKSDYTCELTGLKLNEIK